LILRGIEDDDEGLCKFFLPSMYDKADCKVGTKFQALKKDFMAA
jgi:hypothetical protein